MHLPLSLPAWSPLRACVPSCLPSHRLSSMSQNVPECPNLQITRSRLHCTRIAAHPPRPTSQNKAKCHSAPPATTRHNPPKPASARARGKTNPPTDPWDQAVRQRVKTMIHLIPRSLPLHHYVPSCLHAFVPVPVQLTFPPISPE